MLGTILRRGRVLAAQTGFHVPKRHWSQSTMLIVTPPRVKVGVGEQMVHMAFMLFIWLSPIAYFLTQLKVWRRLYVEN